MGRFQLSYLFSLQYQGKSTSSTGPFASLSSVLLSFYAARAGLEDVLRGRTVLRRAEAASSLSSKPVCRPPVLPPPAVGALVFLVFVNRSPGN